MLKYCRRFGRFCCPKEKGASWTVGFVPFQFSYAPPSLTKVLQILTTSHLCGHRCFEFDKLTSPKSTYKKLRNTNSFVSAPYRVDGSGVEETLHAFHTLTLCGSELWASDFVRFVSVVADVRVSSALGEPLMPVLFWSRCKCCGKWRHVKCHVYLTIYCSIFFLSPSLPFLRFQVCARTLFSFLCT